MKCTNWLLLSLLVCFISCVKSPQDDKPELIKIEGFSLTDSYGNYTGQVGETDTDWRLIDWKLLTPLEKSFLDFADEINMANTRVTRVLSPVAFPNPFPQQSYFYMHADDSVKLKIALVDAKGYVWRNKAVKMKGNKLVYFDFSNDKELPSGTSLRCYFSFSSITQHHFKTGYGDLKICRDSDEYSSCFLP